MVGNFWNRIPDPVRISTKRKRLIWLWDKLRWWDKFSAFDIAQKLFNDTEDEVGQVISRIFREPEIFENRWFHKLVKRFLKSDSFSHSLDDLTSGLDNRRENIVNFAECFFDLREGVPNKRRSSAKVARSFDGGSSFTRFAAQTLSPICRLKEQSNEHEMSRCLGQFASCKLWQHAFTTWQA